MSRLIISEQTTTPATPSSGKVSIYAKTDGYLYSMDDTGTEVPLRGGEENLADTLGFGNSTGGTDIVVSDGDEIVGEGGAGTAGDLTIRGGTDTSAAVAGGDVVIIPGSGLSDGKIVFKSSDETNSIAIEVTDAEQLSLGTTLKFVYDGTTGKLTIPGLIDPTGIVFSEHTAPVTLPGEGAVFVSDGAAGLTAGHLYYVPPSSGSPVDISNPVVAADTLQAAYNAGRTITLTGAATPIEITAGAAAGATTTLLAFKKAAGDGLLSFRHPSATRVRIEGAAGGAAINGTGVEIAGGLGGAGNQDGGSVYLRPGAKTGSGKDGIIALLDPSAGNEVDLYVAAGPTYPGPVVLSPQSGGGSFGATLGPVVNLLNLFSPVSLPSTHVIPNNASVCLYNPNNGLGAGTRNITLPANPVAGQTVVVKDVAGTAAAAPATISGSGGALIDGAASVLLNGNWKSYTFVFNQNWFII